MANRVRHAHSKTRKITVSICVIIAVLLTTTFIAAKPAYRYYRQGIAQCIEWVNSYELSASHIASLLTQNRQIVDQARTSLQQNQQNQQNPSLDYQKRGTSSPMVPETQIRLIIQYAATNNTITNAQQQLNRIAGEQQQDNNQATAKQAAAKNDLCKAKQLPTSLHSTSSLFKELSRHTQQRIVILKKSMRTITAQILNADDKAALRTRQQLGRLVSKMTNLYTNSLGTTESDTTRAELSTAIHTAQQQIHATASREDCENSIDTLYELANNLIRSQNRKAGVDCTQQRCVALTFDDGTDITLTPRIVDTLQRTGSQATFFIMGQKTKPENKQIYQRGKSGYFQVENHTWSHEDFPKIMANHHEALQFNETSKAIEAMTGQPVTMIRPPHGVVDEASLDYICESMGNAIAMYNVDSYDWADGATGSSISDKILAQVEPGSIVLMHDIQANTVAALPTIIAQLHNQGYTLVTIPQLTDEYPRAGSIYYSQTNILRY